MSDRSFVLFTLGPVQRFIEAARSVRDLWSGSYLLSYLTFRAMKSVAGDDPSVIVFPDVKKLPLWTWEASGRQEPAPLAVLEPCIPNRFLAEVPAGRGPDLAKAAEKACRDAWKKIADDVRKFLVESTPGKNIDPYNLWDLQIEQFFEIYTAVLPHEEYGPDRIKALLGEATGNEWSDRHQVAQKMLAAVKNRRHFPIYAPGILGGEVPQKDTLLGTLEHMGPGKLSEVAGFWATAAVAWHSHGSKVTRNERLCAVSLVKRFAWAHHFSTKEQFKRDVRDLKFQDSATVAAAKWLANPKAPNPRECLNSEEHQKKETLWSGQWLHWPTQTPPNDDIDEDEVPDDVWKAIRDKKAAQGKPPTYYAVFMFDGDKMGDHFNAAKNADAYKQISRTLGNFALKVIDPIVTKRFGELLYAGGDDAICVLPTETALACVKEINEEFASNWKRGLQGDEAATISGGLVVAHYKEDLRFVLEQARDAEKKAKAAGRDALQVTVCRRSGEHSSALVPWDFVDTVAAWVNGFLEKASDRWAYKLRGDLPTIGEDHRMFELELGRQLSRAEKITQEFFPADTLKKHFCEYLVRFLSEKRQQDRKTPATDKDAITDFVTLLQTASFLARGRDA